MSKMASMKINLPVLTKEEIWERYILELQAWRELTNLEKKQQGLAAAMYGLPEEHDSRIRDKVLDELGIETSKLMVGLTDF